MNVLLRQPHSFEGAVPVGVTREPSDLAITKGPGVEKPILNLCTARPHPPTVTNGGDHSLLVGVQDRTLTYTAKLKLVAR